MQPPDIDGRGKSQRNPARKPAEETVWGEGGPALEDRTQDEKAARRKAQPPTSALAPTDERVFDGDQRTLTRRGRRRLINTQEALSLRAMGWSVADIAEHLNVGPGTVTAWLTDHRRSVTAGRIDKDLDEIAVPLAKENLIHGLIAGDKDYTLEVLKGRGQFRRHVAQESNVKHDLPPLVIRFEGAPATVPLGDAADPADSAKLITGTVVGTKMLPGGATRTPTELSVDSPVGVGVPSRPHGASET